MNLFNKFVFVLIVGLGIIIAGNFFIAQRFDQDREALSTVIDEGLVQPDNEESQVAQDNIQETSTENEKIKSYKTRLRAIKGCLQTRECHYPNNDPKSYEHGVHKDMKHQLKQVYNEVRAQDEKSSEVKNIALSFLGENNDEVKLEALKILSTQDVNAENVDSIFEEVFESPNPKSSRFSMQIFASLNDEVLQKHVDEKLFTVLTRGSVYSALTVAQNINLVTDSNNRQIFIDAASEIQEQGVSQKVYEELRNQLKF